MAYLIKNKKVKLKNNPTTSNTYVWAFNERGDINKVKDTPLWKLHNKAIYNPESLTREEKDEIYTKLRDSSYGGGTGVALYGVMFSFKPILKKYYVEDKYGGIEKTYAPDKMSIRNHRYEGNSVKKIQEVTD